MRRTAGEGRALSNYLLFELQMTFLMADRLRRHLSGECVLPADIKTACVESLVIHVRALEEFIWGDAREDHPHDALASDFFPRGEWEKTRLEFRTPRSVAWRPALAAKSPTSLTNVSAGQTKRASGNLTSSPASSEWRCACF
jgi:hypothetical protein